MYQIVRIYTLLVIQLLGKHVADADEVSAVRLLASDDWLRLLSVDSLVELALRCVSVLSLLNGREFEAILFLKT